MRRQTPIAHLLYSHLFPHPTSSDPPSFSAHLARNLVPEVRIEVATFYGDLNSAEARYPGLNYCHPPHRMRLGRFKHHKRLFDAFDALALTCSEIQDFCCWEGTKWARERYERDEGVKVVDTTGEEIGPYVDRRELRAAEEGRRKSITRKTDISVIVEEASSGSSNQQPVQENDEEMSDAESEDEDGGEQDETQAGQETTRDSAASPEQLARIHDQSFNQYIIAAWEQGLSLPPDVEQYLKEQSERGTLNVSSISSDLRSVASQNTSSGYVRPSRSTTSTNSAAVVPRAAA